MSYASKKGYEGQQEVMMFLNRTFPKYKFFNVVGSEKTKKTLAGDVCLDRKSDPQANCIMGDYFVEVKKQAKPNIWADSRKARDDASDWYRLGYLLFSIKQARGQLGANKDRLVTMDWDTFSRILGELQGYRDEAVNKTL